MLSWSSRVLRGALFFFIVVSIFSYSLTFNREVWAVSAASVAVSVAPESPKPNENTFITLSSFTANLDTVLISWYVNDTLTSSGIGKKNFSATAPKELLFRTVKCRR
jgi:hypothetical protein